MIFPGESSGGRPPGGLGGGGVAHLPAAALSGGPHPGHAGRNPQLGGAGAGAGGALVGSRS